MAPSRRTKPTPIIDLVMELRNFINDPRTQQPLMKSRPRWLKLCSAMDVIEDTSMAITSYSSQEDSSDKGTLYLETYGVLQALKVRQDATFDLCESLGSTRCKGDFPGLEAVRSARVCAAGHPTKKQRDGRGPHHLVQMSLHRGGFELVSLSADGPKFTQVSITSLIERQGTELEQILRNVISDLKDGDAKHKAQFRGNRLADVFPNILGYCFEKINEDIRGDTLAPMGVWGIEEIRKTLDNLRHALELHGIQIDTYDSIKYLYERLSYPFDELEKYLRKEASAVRDPQAAYIFSYFISGKIAELRAIASEIDQDFGC